ncbi:MAG: hypothetical protein KDD73_15530 [Anaerolineales bacterium]|nr:hypothetical protein [Anaerolineales bacterium]
MAIDEKSIAHYMTTVQEILAWAVSSGDLTKMDLLKHTQNALHVYLAGQMGWQLSIPHGTPTRVTGTTELLVSNAPCIVQCVVGNDGNTDFTELRDANAISGGSTPIYKFNCGDGINDKQLWARFENGLTVKGNDAAHDVTVTVWPL